VTGTPDIKLVGTVSVLVTGPAQQLNSWNSW